MRNSAKTRKTPPLAGRDARKEDVLRRLAKGELPTAIAAALGMSRSGVEYLRDTPTGQARLAELQAEQERVYASDRLAQAEARRALRQAARKAGETLLDLLASPEDRVRATAAVAVLDRMGLTPGAVSLAADPEDVPAGHLTDEELRERLTSALAALDRRAAS